MADNARGGNRGGGLSMLGRFPWIFVVIGYLVVADRMRLDMQGVPGYVFLGLGVLVLFIEFFKSGDIDMWAFLWDLIWATTAVAGTAVLMTYLYFHTGWESISFFHWLGCAIVLGDAILSPFNAFRTALRNLDLHG
jgi:hypothetical protein